MEDVVGVDGDIVAGAEASRDISVDEEAAFERLEFERTDRFDRNMFRSLSLEQSETPGDNLAMIGGSPSLPSNHNPFLGEPGVPSNSGNGNLGGGGAVPRRNSGFVRNVNQGPGTLYNWQATKTTVKERFAFMFNNEILADVHFKVRDENYLTFHQRILVSGWTRWFRAEDPSSQVRVECWQRSVRRHVQLHPRHLRGGDHHP